MARQAQNMIKYVLKRILLMVPILIAVLIFTWVLSHMMSVNPYLNKIGTVYDRETIERLLRQYGYYDPWYVQLGIYIRDFFIGNWGESFVVMEGRPVLEIVAKIFPKTIELMLVVMVVIPLVGIRLGVVSATNRNKPKDSLIRGLAIFGAGFPIFYIATLIQLFVGISLNEFTNGGIELQIVFANDPSLPDPVPSGGVGTGFRIIDSILYNDPLYLFDTIIHLALPTISLIFVSLSGITRQTRSSMLDVLDQDYIRTARAKGIQEKKVINKHALRNAILPTSHMVIASTAGYFLGSLFVEMIFNYTGFGYYMLMAIYGGDYFVINGLLVFSTIIIISSTLVADVAYTIIDPRIIY
ncbi:MAG: ABC transporter permease [Promethearchaeota archaeon]